MFTELHDKSGKSNLLLRFLARDGGLKEAAISFLAQSPFFSCANLKDSNLLEHLQCVFKMTVFCQPSRLFVSYTFICLMFALVKLPFPIKRWKFVLTNSFVLRCFIIHTSRVSVSFVIRSASWDRKRAPSLEWRSYLCHLYVSIGHFQKYHNTLCLSSKILLKHCLYFLVGLTLVPREDKSSAYGKFCETDKEYYGIFKSGLLLLFGSKFQYTLYACIIEKC